MLQLLTIINLQTQHSQKKSFEVGLWKKEYMYQYIKTNVKELNLKTTAAVL